MITLFVRLLRWKHNLEVDFLLYMQFETSRNITTSEFRDLLIRSTLGERRPIENSQTLTAMIKNADIMCTAWDNEKLDGIA